MDNFFTQCSVCCARCCLCLLVISYWLVLRFSHNVLSVVPSVTCVSWLSVIDWSFGFHTMSCLLCLVLPVSLDYHFLIGPSVFTQCSVCCAQCCLCLLVIISWLALRFSHNVLSCAQCCLCLLVANSWLILGILEAINRRADNKLTKNVKRINIDQQNTTHETKGRATQS